MPHAMTSPPRRRPPRPSRAIAAALAAAALAAGCSTSTSADGPPGTAEVREVIDGDTLVVDVGGHTERVRLIGIDTPETVDEDRPVGCYGPEASARTAELLPPGTVVRLERDVEARDRYDRLLAYVTRQADGTDINVLLVEEGYAEASRYPPNTARQAELDHAEAAARAERRGLWGACDADGSR